MAKSQTTTPGKDLEKRPPAGAVAKQSPMDNLVAILKDLDNKEEGVEMVSSYHEFAEGETLRAIVVGMTTMKAIKPGDPDVPAVRFIKLGKDANGDPAEEFVISADAMIVSTLQKDAEDFDAAPWENKPVKAYSITCTGWRESKKSGGEYRTFSIKPLN